MALPVLPELEVVEELGRGGHGVVYRARRDGRDVAVKVLASDALRGTDRLRREAVSLARVRHRALPAVLEIGDTGGRPFLVMELIEGESLQARLSRGALTLDDALDLGIALSGALAAIHGAGLIHLDVQPRNVLFDARRRDVRLVDLGLATGAEPSAPAGGTPGYVAPEVLAGDRRVDARADLYSLGCLLFEASTGTHALLRHDLRRALAEASRSAKLAQELVDGFSSLVSRLVARDPDARPHSAGAVCQELVALRDRTARPRSRGPAVLQRRPAPGALFGRADERALLRRAFGDVATGRGAVVTITSGAGLGKSAVALGFAEDLAATGETVLTMRGEATHRSFGAFRRLLDGYARWLRALGADDRSAAASRGRDAARDVGPVLGVVSPALARALDVDGGPVPGDVAEEVVGASLVELVVRLARAHAPSLLVVDDADQLDPASRKVLQMAARRLDDVACLLLLTARGGDLEGIARSVPSPRRRHLTLEPLSDAAIAELVGEHLGRSPVDAGLLATIVGAAGGSPRLAQDLLATALDEGAVLPHWGRWRVDAARLSALELPSKTQEALTRRIESLEPPTRHLLEVAAVHGEVFRDDVVTAACSLSAPEARAALAEARRASIVLDLPEGRHRFVHRDVPRALVARLAEDDVRAVHARLAAALDGALDERASSPVLYDLARHVAAAGSAAPDLDVPAVCARAAAAALAAFDDRVALELAGEAERAARARGRTVSTDVVLVAAEALLRTGQLAPALEQFERAIDARPAPVVVAGALGRVAWIQMQLDVEAAWRALDRAFGALGERGPARALLGALWAALASLIARALPWRTRRPVDAERLHAACSLHYTTGRLALQSGRAPAMLAAAFSGVPLAERLGAPAALAKAYLLYSFVLTALGLRRRGQRYLDRARAIAAESRDPVVLSHTLQAEAAVAAWAGDVERSVQASSRVLGELGHWRELSEICALAYNQQQIESLRGRDREAWRAIEIALERLVPSGGVNENSDYVDIAARATLAGLGRAKEIPRLVSAEELRRRAGRSRVFVVSMWAARLRWLTERGMFGEDVESLVREFEAEGHDPRHVHLEVTDFYVHLAHARIDACFRAPPEARASALAALSAAERDLARAARIPLLYAHAKVVRGFLELLRGRPSRAARAFATAEALGKDQNAPWILASVHRGRAHLLRARGADAAARDQAYIAVELCERHGSRLRAQRIREELDLDARPSLAPGGAGAGSQAPERPASRSVSVSRAHRTLRFLTAVAESAPAELSIAHQASLALDELLDLLGADRAFLLLAPPLAPGEGEGDGSRDLTLAARRGRRGRELGALETWDARLVEHVVKSADDGLPEVRTSLAADATARWSIAAPLRLREAFAGVLCLERGRDAGPFGEAEGELLAALANQVALGLALTRALAEHDRAADAEAKARRLDALARVAGGLAHDFNNVLAVIAVALPAVREETRETTEEIDAIAAAVSRGRDLTLQLSTFARGEIASPSPLALDDLLEKDLHVLTGLTGRGIRLRTELTSPLPAIRGDARQIRQLTTNLVSNARDAMPDGGTIVLATRVVVADADYRLAIPGARPGLHVVLSVADSGRGMEPEVMERLFEPFFTTKGERGTGLGLATSYGIVSQAGGRIDAWSAPGIGTAFTVHWPSDAAGVPALQAPGAGEVVVVVEPDQRLRRALQAMLRRLGFEPRPLDRVPAGDLGSMGDRPAAAMIVAVDPRSGARRLSRHLEMKGRDVPVVASSWLPAALLERAGLIEPDVPCLPVPFDAATVAVRLRLVLGKRGPETPREAR